MDGGDVERKEATEATTRAIQESSKHLAWEDRRDFEDAERGLIAEPPEGPIEGGGILPAFDPARLAFAREGEAPSTVHPSLWRQAGLIGRGGLFQVTDRLYQVRNMDLSNMTIVEGDTGLIVIDPLISAETARAALDLYLEHRPGREVVAVVYSHSHVDHYGGVRGVVDQEDVDSGKVRIIAPAGFLEAAVSENVMAGNAMSRRSMYQFGVLLVPDERGTVGAGIGAGISLGTITLIPPTEEVTEDGPLEIDGVEFDFMLTPDTEAPAEMHWYMPQLKALTAAENCLHTLHNTYPIRGAQVRDPLAWSRYLNRTIDRWAAGAEVMFGMHHWPVWGRERILEMLMASRDAYRYINDETLRLANQGLTPTEIAEEVRFPPELARHWAVREYYGTVSHNVKATYTRYLGWFDGNPARLEPLPPVPAAERYVEYMGGADQVIARAKKAFESGEYRWVVEVLNHVVFADPGNREARLLAADAMEQLGYQAESATWRNAYLTGAQELRFGTPEISLPADSASPDSIRALSLSTLLDFFAIRLNGREAEGKDLTLDLSVEETGEQVRLELSNGVLHQSPDAFGSGSVPNLETTRDLLDRIAAGITGTDEVAAELGDREGAETFTELVGLLDRFSPWFPIVEP
ncbi:MAG: alkyl/aryl-sulfatase [Solirubrobacterales bacterium]